MRSLPIWPAHQVIAVHDEAQARAIAAAAQIPLHRLEAGAHAASGLVANDDTHPTHWLTFINITGTDDDGLVMIALPKAKFSRGQVVEQIQAAFWGIGVTFVTTQED